MVFLSFYFWHFMFAFMRENAVPTANVSTGWVWHDVLNLTAARSLLSRFFIREWKSRSKNLRRSRRGSSSTSCSFSLWRRLMRRSSIIKYIRLRFSTFRWKVAPNFIFKLKRFFQFQQLKFKLMPFEAPCDLRCWPFDFLMQAPTNYARL